MGKKKPFINKKAAVTYNLIYGATEDINDAPQRLLVDASKGIGIGRPDVEAAEIARQQNGRRYPPGHALAWLEDEEKGPLAEDRRRENIEHGFPDDGYDYLKHLRAMSDRKVHMAEQSEIDDTVAEEDNFTGPSVFIPASSVGPPPSDVMFFDATRLRLHQITEDEEAAAQLMGGVSAFTRKRDRPRKSDEKDIAELEDFMRKFEDMSDCGEGEEGIGDLLDDFVVTATQDDEEEAAAAAPSRHVPVSTNAGSSAWDDVHDADDDDDDDDDDDLFSSDVESDMARFDDADHDDDEEEGRGGAQGKRGPGSIASTYWRPERKDRNDNLSMIDERFEQLALEYDDDEIGALEAEADTIGGSCQLDQFAHVLDDFMEQHAGSRCREAGVNLLREEGDGSQHAQFLDEDAKEAAIAVQKARELLDMAERENKGGELGGIEVIEEERRQERWDCESVLSLASNLYNHPAKISEPRKQRRGNGATGSTHIKLSEKTGMPIGYTQQSRGPTVGAADHVSAPSLASLDAVVLHRKKDETTDEKKERKAAVKEAKREARASKKSLKQAFKGETVKQQRQNASALPSAIPLA